VHGSWLLRSMAQATGIGHHEYVMRAYYNLIEGLWRLGEYPGALRYLGRPKTSAATGTFASTATCSPRADAGWR
jgi:hypothetical protein